MNLDLHQASQEDLYQHSINKTQQDPNHKKSFDLAEDGGSTCGFFPQLEYHHLCFNQFIIRIVNDPKQEYFFPTTSIAGVHAVRKLDAHTLYLRCNLPFEELKKQVGFSFLPF